MVFIFQNDPTVNEFRILVFNGENLGVCEKKRDFWERKNEERIWEEETTHRRIVIVKTDLVCLYIWIGYYEPIIYFIFLYFIIL